MIACDWSQAPEYANFFVELEGGRAFWSSSEIKEMEWVPLLTNEELPNVEDVPGFYSLSVVQCVPRPEWKTMIHFKEAGKLTTYEAEGKLAHGTVKREIISQLGLDKNKSFMLEYLQVS